jgi:hypothetical protein
MDPAPCSTTNSRGGAMREIPALRRATDAVRLAAREGAELDELLRIAEELSRRTVWEYDTVEEVLAFIAWVFARTREQYKDLEDEDQRTKLHWLGRTCHHLDDIVDYFTTVPTVVEQALRTACAEHVELYPGEVLDDTAVLFQMQDNNPGSRLFPIEQILETLAIPGWTRQGRAVLEGPRWLHRVLTTVTSAADVACQPAFAATSPEAVPVSSCVAKPTDPHAVLLMQSAGLENYTLSELRRIVDSVAS